MSSTKTQPCKDPKTQVRSPVTGRCITVNGKAWKKLQAGAKKQPAKQVVVKKEPGGSANKKTSKHTEIAVANTEAVQMAIEEPSATATFVATQSAKHAGIAERHTQALLAWLKPSNKAQSYLQQMRDIAFVAMSMPNFLVGVSYLGVLASIQFGWLTVKQSDLGWAFPLMIVNYLPMFSTSNMAVEKVGWATQAISGAILNHFSAKQMHNPHLTEELTSIFRQANPTWWTDLVVYAVYFASATAIHCFKKNRKGTVTKMFSMMDAFVHIVMKRLPGVRNGGALIAS